MSLITNIVVLYEVPNFFWFALLYYLLYNIVVWGGIWWPKATQPPAGLAIGPQGRQSLVFYIVDCRVHDNDDIVDGLITPNDDNDGKVA